jgi:hypothetical protein
MDLGKIIVFEGPDSCGKTTQLQKVPEQLAKIFKEKENKEITWTIFKFPRYDSFYGKLVQYMLYSDDYTLDNLDNINLFSQVQLDDKLEGMKTLMELMKKYDYILLDRFTLSSRIYDAAHHYLLHNHIISEQDDIQHAYHFIAEWVFTNTFEYLDESLRERYKYIYGILEHLYFKTHYVLFKSSHIIEKITNRERPLDQHEHGSFKKFINLIYDIIYDGANQNPMYMGVQTDDVPIICVDTTKLLSNKFNWILQENDESAFEQYKKIKKMDDSFVTIITNYIADALYEQFQTKINASKEDDYISEEDYS